MNTDHLIKMLRQAADELEKQKPPRKKRRTKKEMEDEAMRLYRQTKATGKYSHLN